ncbi:MAG TPA: cyclic nucleotide-binding domain-containing protein [Anaerolineae bacterium]|nr:cyclic nucleotide-binding domain-containing protein [Anaerolineae bacterium]
MELKDIVATLAMTEMFENLSNSQLELVAALCTRVELQAGQTLFEENDDSNELYIIIRGTIEILINPGLVGLAQGLPPARITYLHQGQVLGEVALVDQGLRSATVRAVQNRTELLVLQRDRLMSLCETYPQLGFQLMRNLAADLALKIRNTDLAIRQLQLMLARSGHLP